MKRMAITLTVPDDTTPADLADAIRGIGTDPTVWNWGEFWADVRDGVLGPNGDSTREDTPARDEAQELPDSQTVTSQDQARQIAVDWQHSVNGSTTYGEIMTTIPPTIKDVSRAVVALQEDVETVGGVSSLSDSVDRVARNLAYTLGKNVNLRKVTGREVALILASHGYTGKLETIAHKVKFPLRRYADEYGGITSQL